MRKVITLTLVAAFAVACGSEEPTVTQPEGSPQAEGPAGVQVKAEDYFFEGIPETLEAGEVTFVLENEGQVSHELGFGRLIGDKSIEEIVQLPESRLAGEVERIQEGIRPIPPGESAEITLDLEPGRYAYVCFVAEGTGKPHALEGMAGEFQVT